MSGKHCFVGNITAGLAIAYDAIACSSRISPLIDVFVP
jgi:hypothetical protein